MLGKPLILATILALGILIGIGAWWAVTHLGDFSIQEVKARCADLASSDQPVRVRGEVAKTLNIPLTPYSVFKITDKSDAIWVVSERDVPPERVSLRVRGRPRSMRTIEQPCALRGYGDADECRALGLAAKFIAGSCVLFEEARE